MSGNAFQMEVLSKSINELQQEKARSEQKLREMRNKRKSLEKKYEAAVTKSNQVEEKQSKMMETVKIAQHKVHQSQAELDSLHTVNKQVQTKVQQVEESVKSTEEQHSKDIEQFEGKLTELVDKFHRSRHFYTDESLLGEIDLMKQKEQELEQETIAVKLETEKINLDLSRVSEKLQETKLTTESRGISAAVQREILSMLSAENSESEQVLGEVREKKKSTDAKLENLAQWTPPNDVTVEE